MPASFATLVTNAVPTINHVPLNGTVKPLTLHNLDSLNAMRGEDKEVFLTSKEGIRALPKWFEGTRPDGKGRTGEAVSAVVVVREHGDGRTVDGFYFYFYAWVYNDGTEVIGIKFGCHVGDWEHSMVRFVDEKPQSVWFSQHSSGQAFTYQATEKRGVRPIGYSANGSHATYATTGTHDHTIPGFPLPGGLLEDKTDAGILWDPLLSAYAYSYDNATGKFRPYDAAWPVKYLYFEGRWGDQQLPDDAEGQVNVFGQRKYTSAPNGVRFKGLVREKVCPDSVGVCIVWPEVRG
ncbi:hypothetical protein FQN50_006114 [Emmonsiellopsis sp. PD_5]|nr:hypothetical protein FQN50_006114 [Emmonsiellopsis sp. PD_5]